MCQVIELQKYLKQKLAELKWRNKCKTLLQILLPLSWKPMEQLGKKNHNALEDLMTVLNFYNLIGICKIPCLTRAEYTFFLVVLGVQLSLTLLDRYCTI
jgi:hypothetical protein